MKTISVLFITLLLGSQPTSADDKIVDHIHPMKSELLKQPIHLKKCSGVDIIEWRPHPFLDSKIIDIIDDACKIAVEAFPKFLETQNLEPHPASPFKWNLCFIPYDEEYRDLNDVSFRFKNRSKRFLADGSLVPIPGYTVHQLHDTFVYNKILNSDSSVNERFITIFTHEMFHAMSWHYGIFQRHVGNKSLIEEKLAVSFTKFLNLGI